MVAGTTGVGLWQIALDHDERALRAAWAILSDDERERAARGSRTVCRRRVLARAGLRRVLAQHTRRAPQALRFEYGIHGKPRLADADGVAFNLSTSGDRCLIAVAQADGAEVGVDIEHLAPVPEADRIAARSFAREDAAAIAGLDGPAKARAFFACWTRGEAYAKARGLGLVDRPAPLSVPRDDWTVEPLDLGDDLIGALAVGRP
jgi:4'-phosphopantetheinyl transferase